MKGVASMLVVVPRERVKTRQCLLRQVGVAVSGAVITN